RGGCGGGPSARRRRGARYAALLLRTLRREGSLPRARGHPLLKTTHRFPRVRRDRRPTTDDSRARTLCDPRDTAALHRLTRELNWDETDATHTSMPHSVREKLKRRRRPYLPSSHFEGENR